jgi:hypothetical protein
MNEKFAAADKALTIARSEMAVTNNIEVKADK